MTDQLTVTSSPHIRHFDSTRGIMGDVAIALCPAAAYGVFLFGWRAALMIAVCVVTAVAAEFLWNLILKKEQTVGDLSALVTGLLLGLNLSAQTPVWMGAVGSAVAIIVVKQMFGGLGQNFANPAITARIVLLVSFPAAMTKFAEPVTWLSAEGETIATATPLATGADTVSLRNLFLGYHAGCIGETASFLLIIGGIYLVLRRVITPLIPVCFVGTVALLAWVSGESVSLYVLGGGLLLGAIFMATDYATSPVHPLGKVIFAVGCGTLTFVIRKFAALPEGVSYSILLMNILTPHIDRLVKTKPFGTPKKGGEQHG